MPVAAGTGVRGLAGAFENRDIMCLNDLNAGSGTLTANTVYSLDVADVGANISAANELVPANSGDLDTDPTIRIDALGQSTAAGFYVVPLQEIAFGEYGLCRIQGKVGIWASGALNMGDFCASDASGQLAAIGAGDAPIACLLQESDAVEVTDCLFDGLNGFINT